MRCVTASEARKNWFTLLDEAVRGEKIVIERNGKRLVLAAEKKSIKTRVPSYKKLIGGTDIDNAHKWGWEWSPSKGLIPVTRK